MRRSVFILCWKEAKEKGKGFRWDKWRLPYCFLTENTSKSWPLDVLWATRNASIAKKLYCYVVTTQVLSFSFVWHRNLLFLPFTPVFNHSITEPSRNLGYIHARFDQKDKENMASKVWDNLQEEFTSLSVRDQRMKRRLFHEGFRYGLQKWTTAENGG